MRNGVRHWLGAGAGLLATPLIAAGLVYGHTQSQPTMEWFRVGALAGAALLVGLLAGSRLSPLASLLPGLGFTGLAVTGLVRIGTGADHRLWFDPGLDQYPNPLADIMRTFDPGSYAMLPHAWSLAIGCVLLAASIFPSRWRGKAAVRHEPSPEEVPEEETPAPPPLPKRIPSRY